MAFAQLEGQPAGVTLLQRSLERGRLGHAWLFLGPDLEPMTRLARALAMTLSCETPRMGPAGLPIDACDRCPACRQVAQDLHPDVHWLRPESRSRQITVDLMRELLRFLHMKANGPGWKVAVLAGADRLNEQAANTFLKTLEEPPARSVLILLTTEPSRVIDTIRSRCLRLTIGGESGGQVDPAHRAWIRNFSETVAQDAGGLLARYRLFDSLLAELTRLREQVQEELTARSPLQKYEDLEPSLRERWEAELAAAIEADYRRRRHDFLAGLLWWLRDVWLSAIDGGEPFLRFPDLTASSRRVAGRITRVEALENLRSMERTLRLLHTNVQEALALEVGLLRLRV